MIVILDRSVLVATYKIMLRNSLSSSISDQEIQESAEGNFLASSSFRGLRLTSRGEKADSSRYFRNYFNLQRARNNVLLGLSRVDEELKNVIKSYDSLLEGYFDSKKKLEKDLYSSIKKTRARTSFYLRFNNFKNKDLSATNTLKHPDLIDYYFSRNSLCDTSFGSIGLPILRSNILIPKNVCVESRFSTKGSALQDASTVKTLGSSHEYICKVPEVLVGGAKLTYCLQMSKPAKINQIEITDSSISKSDLTKIFWLEDGFQQVISYVVVNKGGKTICLLEETDSEYSKVYIEFTQHKYLDRDRDELSTRERLINASGSSFKIVESRELKYFYQFNIDKIELKHNLYKKTGLFRLNENLNLKDYEKLSVKESFLLKNQLASAEAYLEVKKLVNGKESISVIKRPDTSIFDVKEYESGELLYILDSGVNATSGFITEIDIKAT